MPTRTTWYFLAPSLTISLLLLVLGLGGAWYVHMVNRNVSDSLDVYLFDAQKAQRLLISIRDFRRDLDRFANTSDPSLLDAAGVSLRSIGVNLEGLEDQLSGLHRAKVKYEEQIANLRAIQPGPEASGQAGDMVTSIQRDMLQTAEAHLQMTQRTARDASRRNREVAERVGLGLLLLGVCGSAAGLLAGYGIARSVNRSLVQLSVPVRDIAGTLNSVVGPITVSSNTDLSQLDEALRGLAEKTAEVVGQLQESQRQSLRHEQLAAVGQLAAGLAHELRNPLMSMKLIVQTAAESIYATAAPGQSVQGSFSNMATAFSERDLTILDEEIGRLERMLQTFLDFARPPHPAKAPLDLCSEIHATIEVIQPRASQQEVTVHAHLHDAAWIYADAGQLRQVMLNLLINALDAIPAGGNIWVDVTQEAPAPPMPGTLVPKTSVHRRTTCVVVRIRDDGPGLPLEVADRIFEPFVSTKVTGIGLGLSTCRRIVESHDGYILASDRTQRGAEFCFALPLVDPTAAEEER